MEKKWISLALVAGVCISGVVFSGNENTYNLNEFETTKSSIMPRFIEPGTGILLNSKIPMIKRCLRQMPMRYTDFHSTLSLNSSISTEKLAKSLNVDINSKAGWGKFSSSAQAEYVKSAKEDEYSQSFHYQNIIAGYASLMSDEFYGEDALNRTGKLALSKGADEFIAACGDNYIQGMYMGGVLNITLKIQFHNKADKRSFEAAIDGKIGDVFSASTKIKKAVESSGTNGSIEVMAYQTGGEPNLLSSILGAEKEHPIIRCSISSMNECAKAIDELISYAQATGAWKETGFAKQIRIKDGKLEATSIAPIGVFDSTISSYSADFGINIPQSNPSKEVMQARAELNLIYTEDEEELIRLKSILSSYAYSQLSENIKLELKSAYEALNTNFSSLSSDKIMGCFLPLQQEECPTILSEIKSNRIPVDNRAVSLLKDAYLVNINLNWPALWIKNKADSLDIYNTSLVKSSVTLNDLKLTPNYNYSFLSFGGGYTYYDNQNRQVRLYMDYYGLEDIIYRKNGGVYSGQVPWNTCVSGVCSKVMYNLEVIPF